MRDEPEKIIELLSVKGIREVSPLDRSLYTRYFNIYENEIDYGNSWSYYRQAARRIWLCYEKNNTLITITSHPTCKDTVVLIRPIGSNPQTISNSCATLSKTLFKKGFKRVIIKKASEHIRAILRMRGFSSYRRMDGWDEKYRHDDDTYDEFIVQINPLFTGYTIDNNYRIPVPRGSSGAQIRRKINKFINHAAERELSVRFKRYKPDKDREDVSSLIRKWADRRIARYPSECRKELVDSHECFLNDVDQFNRFYDTHGLSKKKRKMGSAYIMYDTQSRKVLGLSFSDKISTSAVGIYAEIGDPEIPSCSELLLLFALERALKSGFQYANLGGAETEGLFSFRKRRFVNYLTQHLPHLVMYCR